MMHNEIHMLNGSGIIKWNLFMALGSDFAYIRIHNNTDTHVKATSFIDIYKESHCLLLYTLHTSNVTFAFDFCLLSFKLLGWGLRYKQAGIMSGYKSSLREMMDLNIH